MPADGNPAATSFYDQRVDRSTVREAVQKIRHLKNIRHLSIRYYAFRASAGRRKKTVA